MGQRRCGRSRTKAAMALLQQRDQSLARSARVRILRLPQPATPGKAVLTPLLGAPGPSQLRQAENRNATALTQRQKCWHDTGNAAVRRRSPKKQRWQSPGTQGIQPTLTVRPQPTWIPPPNAANTAPRTQATAEPRRAKHRREGCVRAMPSRLRGRQRHAHRQLRERPCADHHQGLNLHPRTLTSQLSRTWVGSGPGSALPSVHSCSRFRAS